MTEWIEAFCKLVRRWSHAWLLRFEDNGNRWRYVGPSAVAYRMRAVHFQLRRAAPDFLGSRPKVSPHPLITLLG